MIDTLSIILRALSFIAIFQATGMALFLAMFRRRLSLSVADLIRRQAIVFAIAALILTAAHFGMEPARMGDGLAAVSDASLWNIVLTSPLATAFAWRATGVVVLLVGLLMTSTTGTWLRLIGLAVALTAFTQIGHTTEITPRHVLAALLLAHVLAISFWFGALWPLLTVVRLEASATAASIVERFSQLAVRAVPALFAAGLLLALLMLGSWKAVLSPYGRLLGVKLGLFSILMWLAALNRWRHGPALATGNAAARQALVRCVVAELALISAVLVATAALTTLYSPDS